MTAPGSGLFSFKRQQLLHNQKASEPALFGVFDIWVLECWKFALVDGLPSKLDYRNDGAINRHELKDYLLRKGKFNLNRQPSGPGFEGRLRLIFSVRQTATGPPLSMRLPDFELTEKELNLHPSTPQYVRRAMKASKFWGPDKNTLNLALSFPPTPLIRFSSICLSYNVSSRFTNALIGEVKDVRDGLQVEDFKTMLDTCHAYWAHPLLVPVLLLDMLMSRLEGEILANIASIGDIETTISQLPSLGMDARPLAERENVTSLLTSLHKILKHAIKLLDAARWMRRVADMLRGVGNDLNENPELKNDTPWKKNEWAEIKEFLEDLMHLTEYLVPDPEMTQQRCMSQIDILNSKIAQEDNLLAARMAVAATRDSSAMKALAVITALFLPGTYIATLFSMSMFDWQGGNNSPASSASNGTSSSSPQSAIVMPYIWIYWVISAILTFTVIIGWRIWWVSQDREFRKRLPKVVRSTALDEGHLQTPSATENILAKTFWEEVFQVNIQRNRVKQNIPLEYLSRN